MTECIPMSSADLEQADIQSVLDVLCSGRLALGPKGPEFERMLAEYVGVRHAIAVSSGTAALHLIVRALGLGPGDEVLIPSFTFAASVNALLYEGATPVFVEIEPETYNLDVEDLCHRITPRTRAIMAVDAFGHPAGWDRLSQIAEQHGLLLIDDSCEALGACYKGARIGQFGHAAAFAFYPNKQLTTGEGGMIVTQSEEIARLARSMRNQGRGEMGAWLEHERLGYNYRMDELSAALGVSQIRRLPTFLRKRERVARMYTERLCHLDFLRPPQVKPHARVSWFVYVATLAAELDRDAVMRALAERGVPSRAYFSPLHLQPYVRAQFGFRGGELPVTEEAARHTMALPFHNNLTEAEVEHVVTALQAAVDEVSAGRWLRSTVPPSLREEDAAASDEPELTGLEETARVA
jgi:perosamine synthetase